MKIVVTGVTGQIGSRIAEYLSKDHEVIATVRNSGIPLPYSVAEMDLANPASIFNLIKSARPDIVIHAAAITSPEICDKDRSLCTKINLEGTRRLAEACGEFSAKMVYLSTDLVFDGNGSLYTEDDIPNPLSVYAESKLKGEIAVRELLENSVVARTSIVFGKGIFREDGFTYWLIGNLAKRKKLELYTDQYRSHFYIGDCARAVAELALKKLKGLYHLSSGNRESRYDFAMKVAKHLSLDGTLIIPAKMEMHGDMAKRPKDCSLDNRKLLRETDFEPFPEGEVFKLLAEEYSEYQKMAN